MRLSLLLGTAIALLPFSLSTGHAASIVQNGDFEGGLEGWSHDTNTFLNYDYNGLNHVNHSGQFAVIFGFNSSDHFLSQTLTTTVGTTYDISFWANAANPSANSDPLCVSVGSANAFCSTTPYSSYAERQWTQYSGQFTAISDSTPLRITLGRADGNPLIDDVSVTVASVSTVPLPAALPMFAIALLGLGIVGARARRGTGLRVS